ncbi:hypothetical protein BV53_03185 [Candidatus Synechococcus spongiarum LMB bulk15N]|uniref:Uncharacterized protein n=1 Tax=Candidatus Synechococcus spongiarum LMB bulk15N TaxID=1943583 RepID=A0A1T1D4G7_9SYNE|nr:hypothetical protein BV53_03185 [Candidatus Synechococcus spongiarum LMB bulk15N]
MERYVVLWTACHEGAVGQDVPRPFLYIDLVFKGSSCAQCYDLLCKRFIQEGLSKMDSVAIFGALVLRIRRG